MRTRERSGVTEGMSSGVSGRVNGDAASPRCVVPFGVGPTRPPFPWGPRPHAPLPEVEPLAQVARLGERAGERAAGDARRSPAVPDTDIDANTGNGRSCGQSAP